MDSEVSGFIASLVLGLTFLTSGLSKLRDLNGFVNGVLEYQVLPPRLATIYGKILPITEVVAGAAFILGLWPRGTALLSIALLSSLFVAVTINIARGRQLDCHCFGTQKGERLGWLTVVRLCFLLTLAAVVVRNRGDEFFMPIPASLVLTSLLLSLLLAFGIFLGIYLLGFFPTVWDVLQIKANPNPNIIAHSRRVSFKEAPLNHRKIEG